MKDNKKQKHRVIHRLRANITFNLVFSIVLLLAVFSFIAISIGYWQFSERFTEEYSDNAIRIANAAESYLNTDDLDEYLRLLDPKNQEYSAKTGYTYTDKETYEIERYYESYYLIQALCDKVKAEFIYVIRPDTTDYQHITFVMNVVNSKSEFSPYDVGYVRETTNDDYREKYRRLYESESTEEIVVRDKGFIETGSHITAMIALYNYDNEIVGILCVQRQMEALTSSRIKFTVRVLIVLGVIALLSVVLYFWYMNRKLISPVKIITKETARFSSLPTKAETSLSEQLHSRDELSVLASSIDRMEIETLDYIENLTKATAERQRIGTELELAAQIQQGMLNLVFPEHEAFEIFASMNPAKEVGGDFYDFFMIDADHLCISIADVSGKGIPAAMFMTVSKIMLYDSALVYSSPAEILRNVNERICSNNQSDMFVTVWLGVLDLTTGRMIAANAGHEYPYLYHDGSFELLRDKHGFVIGGMNGVRYTDYEIQLKHGDAIFVYTDGLPEATNAEEEIFGVAGVTEALNSAPAATPFAVLAHMQQAVDAFVADAPQFDDLTMLCLKYKGKPDRQND